VDVHSASRFLHHVNVGSVANLSEAHAAFTFNLSWMGEYSYIYIYIYIYTHTFFFLV
jgi:hypothetical protein